MAVGLLVSGTGAATAAPVPPEAGAPPVTTAAKSTSVTLVTGDRVLFQGDRLDSVVRGEGRENTRFQTFRRDGRLHVVPADALGPLAGGRLDPRLFDVTGLAEAGYDDARRADVPLIVTGDGSRLRAASGLQVTRDLPAAGAFAARAPKVGITGLFDALVADPGVGKVWLDGLRKTSLDRSAAQIGAPTAWNAGFTGKGVKVAVLDTGVDAAHPDLAGVVTGRANFTEEPDNTDRVGHGTHVAATIASRHAAYRGVAPDAQILDGKVCMLAGCTESGILEGIQWAADQGADVVNLSLGGGDTPEVDPLEAAINRLSAEKGTLFVVAAGNSGRAGSVSSPGTADAALSVGAVERDDDLAPFSSKGPRAGDGGLKPDITAPGVDIAAAKSSTGVIGTPVDDTHVAMSGTSMATPHVAGAAAVLAQQHPDWTGAQLKAALTASAKHNPGLGAFDQGSGRVDVAKALTTSVTTDPVSLGFGLQPWPHDDDVPVTRELTYRNTGTSPVTLDLTVESTGPDGKPAPAGVFTLASTAVTVPAAGTATVSVTGDARAGTLDGTYTGAVVASNGLRTALGLGREAEAHDLVLNYTDADGKPGDLGFSLLFGLDNDFIAFPQSVAGVATIRVPKGKYFLFNSVRTNDTKVALVVQPLLDVAGGTTVAVDARQAKPVRITYPDPATVEKNGDISFSRSHGGQSRGSVGYLLYGGFGPVSVAHLGQAVADEDFSTNIHAHGEGPSVGGTPVNYRLAWVERGKAPTGFTRAPAKRELAKLDQRVFRTAQGRTYTYGGIPTAPEGGSGGTLLTPFGPDGRAVDYVLAKGLVWNWIVFQVDATDRLEGRQRSDRLTYRAGRDYEQRYFGPVLSPGLNTPDGLYAARRGDDIGFGVPLWSDDDGHDGDYDVASARITLYRDNVKIGELTGTSNGLFKVPPGKGDFKVDVEAVPLAGATELSTRVAGTWTFRSDTVPGTAFTPLALTVAKFAPELDDAGSAPANRVLRVPLEVRQQQGGPNGKVRDLDVEVSFDDGKTWKEVPVAGRTALVRNGAAGGFASLRVKGSDSRGNTFEHTVIRAYKIRR
ncbi:S8 family serine peptidase [Actinosynnema sp. NPDC023587]|uniref:S8 family serine peptidase n=1 Tax=Actinosynnema sp. NPDC023587 TaxID=3154695 RepID=UPI0033CF98AA